jgi:mono/diheme cytochrome c family protein
MRAFGLPFFALLLGAACSASQPNAPGEPSSPAAPPPGSGTPATETPGPAAPDGIAIPPAPQRSGDPARGYRALVNEGYISLGIPWSGFSAAMTPLQPRDALQGREGKNALVGYSFNVSTNARGVEIASPNCLSCHASHLAGKLVVGLGRPQRTLATPSGIATNPALIGLGLKTANEIAEYQQFGARLLISQEAGALVVFGAHAAHRDSATLAWSSTPRFDARTNLAGWVDVPPWWRTKKKNGLYANGMGRGDHVRHMMNMTIFSVENVAEAERLDAMFVDIAAYLRSIEPPKYPGSIDAALAANGERVFAASCARCHGTYGATATYPNLLVPLPAVGTDPELAVRSWVNQDAVDWFAASFYGKDARLERAAGYVAPPLDGLWATAPFFHNGSVPTLDAVLDSSARPASWRTTFDDDAYDLDRIGWRTGGSGDVYDTTQPGHSNRGHTFGDGLSVGDRRALLEYLKTL